MTQLKKEVNMPEIMKAIKDSVNDARYVAQGLSQSFKGNVQSLRVEESENVFTSLVQDINDLRHFMEFIKELKQGINYFDGFGLPADPISSHDSGLNIFKEMHSAFETKDWIMLSDLIEYELSPLLDQEGEWLDALGGKIAVYGN